MARLDKNSVKERGRKLLKNKSFITRFITSVIIFALLVLAFSLGYTIMLCVLGVLSLIGLWEFYKAQGLLWKPFAICGFIADIFYYVLVRFYGNENSALYLIFLLAIFVLAEIAIFILNYPKFPLHDLYTSFFGVFYVGVTLSFLYITRVHDWGAYLVWLAILSSWGCDVFAYLGGMLFGKHRAFPEISPKKTVEGCLSGIVGAGILGLIWAFIVRGIVPVTEHEVVIFPVICMFGAVIGMAGDLFASAIKRSVGIKDYSHLFPGHGGVLDRFDSVIAVSPIIYVVTLLIRIW